MSKGDQNFLKIQTCVLKVHIHCDGCKQKVKKLLQKIDGVYTVSIDSDHGKVTVSGSVDPSTLIKKLSKSGKHAELLAPKGGSGNNNNKNNSSSSSNNNFVEQLQKLKLEGGQSQQKDNGKPQKGKGDDSGGGAKDKKGQQPPQNMFKDLKLPQVKGFSFPPQKDQKNVKFILPDEFDDGSDLDDDELDDYYDDDDDLDDLDGIDDDYDFDDVLKPMNAKPMTDNKKGNDKKGGEKNNGGKKDGKTGEKDIKGGSNNNGKNCKKGGEKNEVPAMNPKMMGHGRNIGNGPIGAIQGLPQGAAIQGMPVANPYQQQQQQQQQQQYMAMMRQQQQQQQRQQQMMMNMNNGPTVYGQPMGFMPAPPAYAEPYTNYFSDENTNSGCSVM